MKILSKWSGQIFPFKNLNEPNGRLAPEPGSDDQVSRLLWHDIFMRLPLQRILSIVCGLLVAFSSKAPRFHPVFFLPSCFFAGAVTKKKQFSSEIRAKKSSPGSVSSEPGLHSITRMDIDCCNFLHPGMMQANFDNQLHHMQNVRHGCRLASKWSLHLF